MSSLNTPLTFPKLNIEDKELQQKIETLFSPLVLDDEKLKCVKDVFLRELEIGLKKEPKVKSCLQMENTFIPKLLDGKENGSYMALDLGGTNFRVMEVELIDGKITKEILEHYEVPLSVRVGPGQDLFDFLAFCIQEFLKKNDLIGRSIKLGFTFSFPMVQEALDVGILATWTKSFKCPGVVGKDAVLLLNEAIQRTGIKNISVIAVLNDTTGTLIKGSYLDKRCAMGMILGTGCNGCYIEKTAKIEKCSDDFTDEEMIIDIEWGAFGDNGCIDFIRTEWDDQVDAKSLLPKSFLYDKYIGGKYIGDIVRECLITLSKLKILSNGTLLEQIQNLHFETAWVSQIEQDNFDGTVKGTEHIFMTSYNHKISEQESKIVQYVSGVVSYRTVQLASLLPAVVLERMKREHCTIAVDGSVYKNHPRFKPLMDHLIHQYSPHTPFNIIMARDGSGTGAALVAAIADNLSKK